MNITIPAQSAGGAPGVFSMNFSGPGFSLQQASGSFTLRVGSGTPQTVAVGQSIGKASGPALGWIEFSNATATAINVTLGDYGVNQVTVSQANAKTFVPSTANLYDIGSAVSPAGVTFSGVDSSGRHRRTIYISNTGYQTQGGSSTTALVAVSLGGNFAFFVWPQTVQAIETDADVTIIGVNQNVGGFPTHLQAGVLEIFYTQALQTNQ